MKLLNRDDILKAQDLKLEKVDMNAFGWGGFVNIRGMTGAQRGKFEADMGVVKGPDQAENWKRFRAKMLVMTVVDNDGNPLFREQDVDALNEKSAAALDYLFEKAQALSGYRKQDVEEMTKNLQTGQSDDS